MIAPRSERSLLAFANWAVFGFLGLGFIAEGFARDAYLVGLIGILAVVLGFIGHLVLNQVFGAGFSPGEAALGLALFGLVVVVFVSGWLVDGYSPADFYLGLTLFSLLVLGFVVYLATRHGMRGAFSHFHVRKPKTSGTR